MRVFSRLTVLLAFFLPSLLFVTPVCLGDELIAPTRTLHGTEEATGRVSVFSETVGLDAFLDGSNIGKTPVWLKNVEPGLHTLKVKDSETQIHVQPGKTLQVSLFKGSFIRTVKEEKKVEKQAGPEEEKLTERRKAVEPPKEERERDLTPWELFINRSSRHF